MEEHAFCVTLTRLINVFAKARIRAYVFVAATIGSSPQQNCEHSRSTFSSTFLRKSRTKPWKVEQTFMNFRLARNAVYKYPIFAHVDNAYANIPLTKPPTDAKQRLSANGYRSPSQKGRCPLFCCTRLLRSVMQGRFVIILVDEFLAKWTSSMNRFVEKTSSQKRNLHAHR